MHIVVKHKQRIRRSLYVTLYRMNFINNNWTDVSYKVTVIYIIICILCTLKMKCFLITTYFKSTIIFIINAQQCTLKKTHTGVGRALSIGNHAMASTIRD